MTMPTGSIAMLVYDAEQGSPIEGTPPCRPTPWPRQPSWRGHFFCPSTLGPSAALASFDYPEGGLPIPVRGRRVRGGSRERQVHEFANRPQTTSDGAPDYFVVKDDFSRPAVGVVCPKANFNDHCEGRWLSRPDFNAQMPG